MLMENVPFEALGFYFITNLVSVRVRLLPLAACGTPFCCSTWAAMLVCLAKKAGRGFVARAVPCGDHVLLIARPPTV